MRRRGDTVRRLTSYAELETLCGAMVKDWFRQKRRAGARCVDIEEFAKEYLGLAVTYESFAEPDPGRIGFLSDGARPLRVRRNGGTEEAVFPAGTVVVEKFLLGQRESGRRRFTIAHEAAHAVLQRHVPAQTGTAAAFFSGFDPDAEYSADMLRGAMSVNECFANRAAACLLMPRFLTEKTLARHNASRPVTVYGEGILSQDTKFLVQKMADEMGVSYTAFLNRLRELDLTERRPVEEYLRGGLRFGGGTHENAG